MAHKTTTPLIALTAVGALALAAGPAGASLVISAPDVTAAPGAPGGFDVSIASTGGSFNVSGFSFELSVPSGSGITFTGVNTSMTSAPYIFGTLQSPPFSFDTFPNTDFAASDSSMTAPGFTTVDALHGYALGHVSYSVAPGTALGPVTVSFVPGANTSVNDLNGNPIPFMTQNGTISVANASAAPEPSQYGTLALIAAGLGGLILRARRRTRAAP